MQVDTTRGSIWKPLLAFFFPILLGTFFQQLYNTADAIIVGNFVGKEALAAVGGTTSVIVNFFVNLFVGISSGTTVVIAQHCGARDYEALQEGVHTSMALALTAGLGITVVGLLVATPALKLMGTPADVMGYAQTYLKIYFLGTIASFIYNMGASILRAMGDSKRPLYFLICACLVNIALDYLLVVGLGLEVLGAAVATVLSQVVSAGLVLLALCKKDTAYHLTFRKIRFHKRSIQAILRIGLPAGLQSDMYSLSNILLQSCVNSFGTNTVAAWAAFGKVDGFFWMVSSAYGVAITTFVGQNFGARQYDRIHRSVRVCGLMMLATTALFSGVYCLLPHQLLSMFNGDPEVLSIGTEIIYLMCPFYVTYLCVELFSGAIRGTGSSLVPMLLTCGGVCVLRILWVLVVLPVFPQFETVVVSYPFSWVVTTVLFLFYYFKGGWLEKRIRASGHLPEVPAREEAKPAKVLRPTGSAL